jgi:hypothetical protein
MHDLATPRVRSSAAPSHVRVMWPVGWLNPSDAVRHDTVARVRVRRTSANCPLLIIAEVDAIERDRLVVGSMEPMTPTYCPITAIADRYTTIAEGMDARVNGCTAADWSAPTPCPG